MSHNKQKLSTCDKHIARETKLVAKKYRMFVCETIVCHHTKYKNIVSLVAQKSYLLPTKTEIAFVRQTTIARETKNCRPKTQNVCATRGYRRTTDKNIIFVRQDLSPVRQFCRLKTQKLITGDISSSHVRQQGHLKTQSVLVRQELDARETKLSPKNAETVFLRQAHTNTVNL